MRIARHEYKKEIFMNTLKLDKADRKVKMVAHRGVSGLETQNSAAAFVAAGNRSYFGIETDVHVTSDGKYIIIHDDNPVNISGDDMNVEQTEYDVLRSLILYDIDGGKKTRRDLVLPSLREYIRICRKYEKICVLELKNQMDEQTVVGIVDEIRSECYLESVIFISFSYENLVILRNLLPNAKLQYLTGEAPDERLLAKLNAYSLDLDIIWTSLSREGVEFMHENGIEVNCWTVDDLTVAATLADWGVDYITTNIIE